MKYTYKEITDANGTKRKRIVRNKRKKDRKRGNVIELTDHYGCKRIKKVHNSFTGQTKTIKKYFRKKRFKKKPTEELKPRSFFIMKPENPKKHTFKNKLDPNNGLPISSGYETNRKRH